MRRHLRIAIQSLTFVPWLATCGGTEPSEPAASRLQVSPVQAQIADRTLFTPVLAVQLLDEGGSPVHHAGVAVAVEPGSAGLTLIGPTVVLTDEDGVARFEGLGAKGSAGTYFLRFTAPDLTMVQTTIFVLAAGIPATAVLTSAPDSLPVGYGAGGVAVTLRDSSSNVVPAFPVTLTVLEGGGSVSPGTTTQTDGRALLSLWRLGQVPGINRALVSFPTAAHLAPIEVEVRGHVGAARQLGWSWGLAGELRIDTTYLAPVIVTVRDTFGNVAKGRSVTFTRLPATTIGTATTDSLGQAVLESFPVGTVAGAYPFRASVATIGAPISRDTQLMILPGPPASITSPWVPFAGHFPGATRDGQVSVVDQFGNPRPGEAVAFRVAQGGGSVTPAMATANAAGIATFHWTLGTSGPQRLAVTAGAVSGDTLSLAGVVYNPVAIQVIAGDGQTGVVGTQMPVAPAFRAVDSAGTGVPGVPLDVYVDDEKWATVFTDSAGYNDFGEAYFRTVAGPWTFRVLSPWVLGDTAVVHLVSLPALGHHFTGPSSVGGTEAGVATDSLPTFRLFDVYNNPVGGVWARFSSTDGSFPVDSAFVDSAGWVRSPRWIPPTVAGMTTVTVSWPGPSWIAVGSTQVRVGPGPVASFTLLPGRAATGFAGELIAVAPRIQGYDQYGNTAGLRPIVIQVTQGGGAMRDGGGLGLGPALDANGITTVDNWELGSAGPNQVRVSSGPAALLVDAEALPAPAFSIRLRNVHPSFVEAFRVAAFDWSRRLTADIPDLNVAIPAGACSSYQSAFNGTVDDLIIDVAVVPIDGPGAILGGAGPCVVRTSGGLPLLGVMIFDFADVAQLEQEGTLDDVILHEMGHVLGIGTLWSDKGLLQGAGTSDPQYTGTLGKLGWSEIGGAALGTPTVPVENSGGQGTADSHWRESIMPSELMTGYLSAAVNPLSRVTLRSLGDLGYGIDVSTADNYTVLTAPPQVPGGSPVRIRDTLFRPRMTVDDDGRVRGLE